MKRSAFLGLGSLLFAVGAGFAAPGDKDTVWLASFLAWVIFAAASQIVAAIEESRP